MMKHLNRGKSQQNGPMVPHAGEQDDSLSPVEEVEGPTSCIGWAMFRLHRLAVWTQDRLGTRYQMFLVIGYFVVEGLKLAVRVSADKEVNPTSVLVMSYCGSLAFGLLLSFSVERASAIRKIFCFSTFVRFFGVAFLFNIAAIISNSAAYFTTVTAVTAVGQVYLPTAALLSLLVRERKYGRLEWLSLGIMTCGVITFVDLHRQGISGADDLEKLSGPFVALLIFGATTSALASIIAERLYKNRSSVGSHRFYIYKVHLDYASLLIVGTIWALPSSVQDAMPMMFKGWHGSWFGKWDVGEFVEVVLLIAQAWFAGLLVKNFSTVFRAVAYTLLTVVSIFFTDAVFGAHQFYAGVIACTLLLVIVVLSALVFQTGRLNIRGLKEHLDRSRIGSVLSHASSHTNMSSFMSRMAVYCRTTDHLGVARSVATKYGAVIFFIMSDAARQLAQQQALSRTSITPSSLVLSTYIGGVAIATILTVSISTEDRYTRLQNLQRAYSWRHILRCFPCACLFASAQTLQVLAYTQGISAALSTALGYVYMPIAALFSRWFVDKFYMWLEWFTLLMLTCASAVFGLIQSVDPSTSHSSSGVAMLLVLSSASTSVLAGLYSEKILKQAEQLPFHMQKVGLDFGSAVATLLLLPVIGGLSTRPQDAFWKERPLSTCSDSRCFPQTATTCNGHSDCSCVCMSGLYVDWGNFLVSVALLVNITQAWLTGIVIKQFSTVLRAIAQSSTLLAIYFVGSPLVTGAWKLDVPSTLIAFIIPMSTATFMCAKTEIEKVHAFARQASFGHNQPMIE
jgi:TM2 domain-containing membrane protein YozV